MLTTFQVASQNITQNLRLAKSEEERHDFARVALLSIADSVLPSLDRYGNEKGQQSTEYAQAQEEVIQLVALVGIPFVRNCTNFREAVTILEEIMGKCQDLQVRKKLGTYSNQLKQRWNQVEPGGIMHALRASKRTKSQQTGEISVATWIALFLFAVFLFAALSTYKTSVPRSEATTVRDLPAQPVQVAPIPPSVPVAETQQSDPHNPGVFYRYTDDDNIIHLVNDAGKIPTRFRSRAEVVDSGPISSAGAGAASAPTKVTSVDCRGNRVRVPVTLKYRGREVRAIFLLDTGATITSINPNLAARLELDRADTMRGTSTLADGRRVPTYQFKADTISVDGHSVSGAEISVLSNVGDTTTDGLLGMNFLKEFRYHVDFKRGMIEWI